MLSTNFIGWTLGTPVMNASGCHCMTIQELDNLNNPQTKTSAFITKTSTFESRTGNEEPRQFLDNLGSLNSMGIPNLGYQKYDEYLTNIQTIKLPNTIYFSFYNPRITNYVKISE